MPAMMLLHLAKQACQRWSRHGECSSGRRRCCQRALFHAGKGKEAHHRVGSCFACAAVFGVPSSATGARPGAQWSARQTATSWDATMRERLALFHKKEITRGEVQGLEGEQRTRPDVPTTHLGIHVN